MSNMVSPVNATTSEVSGGRTGLTGWQKLGVFGVMGAVVVGAIMFQTSGPRQGKPAASTDDMQTNAAGAPFRAPRVETDRPVAAAVPLPAQTAGAFPLTTPDDPVKKARQSSILGSQVARVQAASAETAGPGSKASTAGSEDSPLSSALKPTTLEGTRATLLPHPDLTITMGTPFPCTPQQPMTSDLPGLVSCIVPTDVRGTTGAVVLLPRGTKIVGTIQGTVQQGHQRLFVLWQRAETPNPDHVVITLNSPAADQLGQAGLDGDINTHFWQRFGGAILLSFIDSGLQAMAAAASSSSGNGGINFNSFQNGGQNAASTAPNSTINIPPTLHRDQALPATVFTARDLDFSGVYGLRLRGAR